jgi:hypothetical protein
VKKIRRDLAVITGELQTAMKAQSCSIIAIGGLLLEARAQVDHGEWMDWLFENFDSSTSTAENFMNAARAATKFPTVGNLKLRPTALYLLGSEQLDDELFNSDVINAILQKAETTWVSSSHASNIAWSMRPKPELPTEAEIAEIAAIEARRKALHEEIEKEIIEEEAEIESILDGPPPELPAAATVHDVILPPFDQAIKTLGALKTKPLEKFIGTAHKSHEIRGIRDFLDDVADLVDRQRHKASA